ncbi:unnamed protein product [Cuscuta epithymum]|uniref:Uncharacterized protein n=1 Tax=Cuscuta epithymum TaxID=186058 RepID=A0AAV0G2W8_9ASTE|nr:unnamed protein product [Cuscuta epithymum]
MNFNFRGEGEDGVRNLASLAGRSLSSFPRRPHSLCSFSTNQFTPPRASKAGIVSSSTAAGLVEDLLFDDVVSGPRKSDTDPIPLQPGVVVYDGVCHLCHKGVKWVIEADKDRKIKFCCLQSKAAEPYMSLRSVDRNDVLRRFLFIERPGLYYQGSTDNFLDLGAWSQIVL